MCAEMKTSFLLFALLIAVSAVAETPAYERPPSMLYGWGLARLSVLELAEACLRDSQESYARVEKEMSEIVKEKKQLQDQVKVSEDKIRGLTAESIRFVESQTNLTEHLEKTLKKVEELDKTKLDLERYIAMSKDLADENKRLGQERESLKLKEETFTVQVESLNAEVGNLTSILFQVQLLEQACSVDLESLKKSFDSAQAELKNLKFLLGIVMVSFSALVLISIGISCFAWRRFGKLSRSLESCSNDSLFWRMQFDYLRASGASLQERVDGLLNLASREALSWKEKLERAVAHHERVVADIRNTWQREAEFWKQKFSVVYPAGRDEVEIDELRSDPRFERAEQRALARLVEEEKLCIVPILEDSTSLFRSFALSLGLNEDRVSWLRQICYFFLVMFGLEFVFD